MATRTISNAGGNWNAVGTWVEGVTPTSSDDVVATATSGPLTVNVTSAARSMDLTGYANTLTLSGSLTLGTSTAQASLIGLKLSASMTVAGSQGISLGGSYAADFLTIDAAGKTLPGTTGVVGTGKWKLANTFNGSTFNVVGGTFDFNGHTVNVVTFSSTGAGVRTVTIGTATLNASNQINFNGSNLTLSAASSTINVTASNSTLDLTHAGIVLGTLAISSTGPCSIQGSFTCTNLTRTGGVAANARLGLGANGTTTVTGALTITDNSGSGLWVGSGLTATASPIPNATSTIALGATGTASLTGVHFTGVVFTGTATPVSGTRLGDGLGNSGITFSEAPRNLYWVGGVGNWNDPAHWATTSGGAGGAPIPLPQDDVFFDANSFTANNQTVTTFPDRLCRNLSFAPTRTGCRLGNSIDHCVFGSFLYGSNTAMSGGSVHLLGRGTHTFSSAAPQLIATGLLRFNSGTYTLTSDVTVGSGTGMEIIGGTVNLDSLTLAGGGMVTNSGTAPRTLNLGTGTLKVSASSTFGTAASGFTLAGSGTLLFAPTSSPTLTSAGNTIPNLSIQASAFTVQLADTLTVSGAITHTGSTFNTSSRAVTAGAFSSTGTTTRTILLGASAVTVNGDFVLSGTGLTFTPGTSTVTVNGQSTNTVIAGNGLTFNNLTFAPNANINSRMTVHAPGLTAATFAVNANNAAHGTVVLNGNVTTTTSFTATGQAGNPVYIYGPDWGGQATVASPTPTLNNVAFNRVIGTGGSWAGTGTTFTDDAWKQAVAIA